MVPGVQEEQKTQSVVERPAVEKPAVKKLRSRLSWKALLYHPLTWLAIGAHVVLLVVPFNPDKPVAVEPEESEEEIDESIPVDILNLSALSAPEPPPDAPLPEPVTTPPAPTAAPPPAEVPAPPAVTAEPAVPDPATPTPATPDPPEEDPPPPAYDPGGDQTAFTGNLGRLGLNAYTFLPEPGMFPNGNSDRFLNFADPNNPVPLSGSLGAQLNDKQPGNVLGVMQDAYAGSGLVFTEWTPYEGEKLYQLSNPDGKPFMYVSVVDMNGSSLLVMWSEDPTQS